MASNVPSERKLMEIEEIAAGWGKLLARESFPEGPGLDVSLADMEDIVARATRAIVLGLQLEDSKVLVSHLHSSRRLRSCGGIYLHRM